MVMISLKNYSGGLITTGKPQAAIRDRYLDLNSTKSGSECAQTPNNDFVACKSTNLR